MSSFEDDFLAEIAQAEEAERGARAMEARLAEDRIRRARESRALLNEYARRFARWAVANGVGPTEAGGYWVVAEPLVIREVVDPDTKFGNPYSYRQIVPRLLVYADGRAEPEGEWVMGLYKWARDTWGVDLRNEPRLVGQMMSQ